MMEYLISAIWVGLELTCSILFCGAFLERKKNHKYSTVLVAFMWLFMVMYTNLGINRLLRQFFTIAIFALISSFLYLGNCAVHLFLSFLCYIFLTTSDIFFVNSACKLWGISINEFVLRTYSYVIVTTAGKLLMAFSAWLLYRHRARGSIGKTRNQWILLTTLFPATSAVMFGVLFYQLPRNTDIPLGIFVYGGILLVANAAMLYIIHAIERASAKEQEVRLLKQQISLQAESYGQLKESYQIQRKATHEFEHHIQALQGLLENNDYDSVKAYIKQLQADRSLRIFNIHSNNSVIDVVLNQKHQAAQRQGIKMWVQVNDLSHTSIPMDALVVLLSNLLDNAIEACLQLDTSKEIVCRILDEDVLYLSIRNTSKPVIIFNGEISTSKPDASEHGYGLPAVKYILEQLKAEYTFEYKDGWFQFAAEIPR